MCAVGGVLGGAGEGNRTRLDAFDEPLVVGNAALGQTVSLIPRHVDGIAAVGQHLAVAALRPGHVTFRDVEPLGIFFRPLVVVGAGKNQAGVDGLPFLDGERRVIHSQIRHWIEVLQRNLLGVCNGNRQVWVTAGNGKMGCPSFPGYHALEST